MILLDANTLLRLTNKSDPDCRRTQQLIFKCRSNEPVVIAPQSLFEFWAVATRARLHNGLGMDIFRTRHWISHLARMFPLLPDPHGITKSWAALVEKYAVAGFRAHDARYVAAMELHRIDKLMTYNVKDFSFYPITIIDPRTSV